MQYVVVVTFACHVNSKMPHQWPYVTPSHLKQVNISVANFETEILRPELFTKGFSLYYLHFSNFTANSPIFFKERGFSSSYKFKIGHMSDILEGVFFGGNVPQNVWGA